MRSRVGKEDAIAEALRAIAHDDDDLSLATAVRMACGRVLPVGDGRTLGVGWSLLLDVVRTATGFDDEVVIACARTTGELAEAFGLLARRRGDAERRPGVALRDVESTARALASTSARAPKRALLDALFAKATPLETKYLAKALGGGLRIGAQEGIVEAAVGRAFGASVEAVRHASALITDIGEVAMLAKHHQLDAAELTIGRPLAFMLATPIEATTGAIDPAVFAVEDKIDGIRAQVHRSGEGTVAIFVRGLDERTDAFPEIVAALRGAAGAVILDGEIVAVGPSGRPRPFQALQPRLKRTHASATDLAVATVVFVAFDRLADDSGSLLHLPWSERRAGLIAMVRALGAATIVVHPVRALSSAAPPELAIDAEFEAARARGHEGIVLKRIDAPYDAGRRGQLWLKVKRAHATLDVVVVAAQEGHGRRAGALSDYTFAVWRDDELVVLGKAYSGLTDEAIDEMTLRLEGITVGRRGGTRLVRPEIVLEVAFDGVQRSSRHPSGFALRFPRIVRVRDDKTPAEADRLEAVQALLANQVASGHREADVPKRGRPSRRTATKRQLSLFDDDDG
jgi:DNA ligase-1